MHPFIHIGALTLSSYRVMLIAASAVTVFFVWLQRKSYGLSGLQSILFQMITVFCAFCAGKIMFLMMNPSQVLENGILASGFSMYGPIFLGILIDPLIGRCFGLRPLPVLDLSALRFLLFIGCQRIGCYMAGCCGGWEACVFGVCFRWPAQMIESIGDFLIFTILLEKRQEWKNRLYPIFLILYGTLRFFVEFLRESNKIILSLSHWQWFSILAVLVGFLWNRAAKEKSNG